MRRDKTPLIAAKAGIQSPEFMAGWIPACAGMSGGKTPLIPAKAGIQSPEFMAGWIPACAGMSGEGPRSKVPLIPAKAGIQEDRLMSFWVYILASRRNATLYVGMTDNLVRRAWEHREGIVPGFTQKYGVKTLVWYEQHESRESAFARERQLKKWRRDWKLQLIERANPQWKDLAEEIGPQ